MPERHNDHEGREKLSFFLQQQLVDMAKKGFLQLGVLLRNASLYPPAHPFLLGSAEQLLVSLEELCAKRKEASYHFVDGELFFETFSVPMEEMTAELVEGFTSRVIGGLTFQQGVAREELVAFAYLMKRDPQAIHGQGGITPLLHQAGVKRIQAHALLTRAHGDDQQHTSDKKPSEIYREGIETVEEIIQSAFSGNALNARRIQSLTHTMVDSILDNRDALVGLTSIKFYDEYTFVHSLNVAILSMAMGAFLSLDKAQIAALGVAGMLHDIGKVNIPLEIINKPGSLTDAEWEIVKRHPVEGALILSGLLGVGRVAMVTAFEHHRQYNLKGYPLTADEHTVPHAYARIIALADAYDALTSVRVYYRVLRPPDEAVRILLGKRGTLFDPVLVKALVNMVGIFPIGTLLRLDTEEIGLVTHQTRDLLRPRILLLRTFDGTEREETNLLEMESGRYKRTAVASVHPNDVNVDINQYFT